MRVRAVLSCLLVSAAAVVLNATPAQAASPLQFGKVVYNSPGTDTRTNTSLNAEYVAIRNVTATTRCLTGWTVRDAAGATYRFGTFCLGGYRTVYLHTGRGTNTSLHRYWNSGNYIWNNTGDRAWLRNASGVQMDYCAWGNGIGYLNC